MAAVAAAAAAAFTVAIDKGLKGSGDVLRAADLLAGTAGAEDHAAGVKYEDAEAAACRQPLDAAPFMAAVLWILLLLTLTLRL